MSKIKIGTFVIQVSSRSIIINHTFNSVGSLIRLSWKILENFIKEIIRSRYELVVCIMTIFTSMRVRLVLDILRESKNINDLKISLFTLCIWYIHKCTGKQVCHIRADSVLPYWQFRTFNIGLLEEHLLSHFVLFFDIFVVEMLNV